MILTKADRIVGALRGAFVADAASMGTHWIYNPIELATSVGGQDHLGTPEFMPIPPTPKFYSATEFPGHYGPGQLSPYGEQLLFVTDFIANHHDTTTTTIDGLAMSNRFVEWVQTFGGRPDHAMTTMVTNVKENGKHYPDCGADDSQAHIYMKIIPVVCQYAGSADLKEKITTVIRIHQNNDMAIRFGVASGRILEAIILGAPSLQEALATVESNLVSDLGVDGAKDVQAAFEKAKKAAETLTTNQTLSDFLTDLSHELMSDQPDSPFYDFAARSCGLPQAFIGPLVQLYRNNDLKYVDGIRENILAAGDTCSRGIFLGAVLGAYHGGSNDRDGMNFNGVPASWWSEKLDGTVRAKVDGLQQKIIGGIAATTT